MGGQRARIRKTFRFEAAHQLPNHSGKCRRVHGHNYRVDVVVSGPVRPADGSSSEGMVLDFGDLKLAWAATGGKLDHQPLHELFDWPTTAENLAAHLMAMLSLHVNQIALDSVGVESVTVWETDDCSAEVRWDE